MNQKAYVHLEVIKEDRVYTLEMPFGAQYQECYDVAVEFANKIIEISNQAEEQRKAAEVAKQVAEQESSAPVEGE